MLRNWTAVVILWEFLLNGISRGRETHFMPNQLRRNIFGLRNKTWFLYVSKISERVVIKEFCLVRQSLSLLLSRFQKVSLWFKQKADQIAQNEIFDVSITEPVGNLYTTEKDLKSQFFNKFLDRPIYRKHFLFELSNSLRLKLAFERIFFSSFYSTGCHFGNMTVFATMLEQVYCGQHPFSELYPMSPKVIIQIVTEGFMYYNIKVFFSIIDIKILETYSEKQNEIQENRNFKFVFWLRQDGAFISHVHIHVYKFQYLVISLKNKAFSSYLFYDGPGTESKIVNSEKTTREIFTTTSFQCTMFIFTKLYSNVVYQELSITAKNRNIRTIHLNESSTLVLPNVDLTGCNTDSITCAITTVAPPGLHINVTTLHVELNGVMDSMCSTGGVAAYEHDARGKYSEVATFCHSFSQIHTARNIYSQSSKLMLVWYTYKEYNNLEVSFHISSTSCTPVPINIWENHAFCDYFDSDGSACPEYLTNTMTDTPLTLELDCDQMGQFKFCDGILVTMEDLTCVVIQPDYRLDGVLNHTHINRLRRLRGPRLSLRFAPMPRAGTELEITLTGYSKGMAFLYLVILAI